MCLLLISILDITLHMIFLMMMISIDNVEHYLFEGILYCESIIYVPSGLGVKLTLFRTYCSYSTTVVELQKNLPLLNYKFLIIFF